MHMRNKMFNSPRVLKSSLLAMLSSMLSAEISRAAYAATVARVSLLKTIELVGWHLWWNNITMRGSEDPWSWSATCLERGTSVSPDIFSCQAPCVGLRRSRDEIHARRVGSCDKNSNSPQRYQKASNYGRCFRERARDGPSMQQKINWTINMQGQSFWHK